MFRTHQIITSSKLVRRFGDVAKMIQREPQAVLIIQKGREPLVILPAIAFEQLCLEQNFGRLTERK